MPGLLFSVLSLGLLNNFPNVKLFLGAKVTFKFLKNLLKFMHEKWVICDFMKFAFLFIGL